MRSVAPNLRRVEFSMAPSLDFPWPSYPGEVTRIAPGLLWARLPLPFRLDHVNIWLVEEDGGWTIVDTGCDTAQVRAAWEDILAGPMAARPVVRLLATHGHVDHIGLAGWLCERFDCPFVSTLGEWLWARGAHEPNLGGGRAGHRDYLERSGLTRPEIEAQLKGRDEMIALAVPLPGAVREIRHGQEIVLGGRRWEVIVTPGHAFFHASLLDREAGILIAGDQLLPHISPVIAVWETTPHGDPLGDFLASFEAFATVPDDTLVLPSHGLPYRGIGARIAALRDHHKDRLELTQALLDQPRTARDVALAMFPKVTDVDGIGFALAEVLAHLNRLVASRRVERIEHRGAATRYVRCNS